MMRSIAMCLVAASVSAVGCAAPSSEEGADEAASSENALANCPPEGCDPGTDPAPPPPKPDLRAEIVNATNHAYCSGTVQFRIVNVGTANASASTARASASGNTSVDFAIPYLAKGAASPIYSYTWRPQPGDVGISIFADVRLQISESNESNNRASGYCFT